MRGQDALLDGASTAKVNKKLNIAPVEMRKSRPNGMLTQNRDAKSLGALLKKVGTAVRLSNIFQKSTVTLNDASTDLGDGDEDTDSMTTDNKPVARPNLDKAKQFTDLLKNAASTQQSKAAAAILAAQQAALPSDTAVSATAPVGIAAVDAANRFRSKVLANRRARMSSVSSHHGGGSPLRKSSSASHIADPRHSVMRKSSTASNADDLRKNSVLSASQQSPSRRANSRVLHPLSAVHEHSLVSNTKPRSASSAGHSGKKHSVSSPSAMSRAGTGLGANLSASLVSSDPEEEAEARPKKGRKKSRSAKSRSPSKVLTLSGGGFRPGDSDEGSGDESDQFNAVGGLPLVATPTKGKTRNASVSSVASHASASNEKKGRKSRLGSKMHSIASDGSDADGDAAVGHKPAGSKRHSTLRPLSPGGADQAAADGRVSSAGGGLLRTNSGGRASRIGSKATLALEMVQSKKVTRLPAMVDGAVKLTRRKDSAKS